MFGINGRQRGEDGNRPRPNNSRSWASGLDGLTASRRRKQGLSLQLTILFWLGINSDRMNFTALHNVHAWSTLSLGCSPFVASHDLTGPLPATCAYRPRDILHAFAQISRWPIIALIPPTGTAPGDRREGRGKADRGSMSRPNRSDAHLSAEDEATREAEVREYYDDAAPKRHTKPSRSEHSAVYADALVPDAAANSHPELDKFQELEAHTKRLVYEGGKVGEEFVETEYYKDLGGVGKQHHTTGTGFIKMDKPQGASFELFEDRDAGERHASCKGNPATNDWIPSADTVYPASEKPNRSDS